jgi:hypothetical protein
MFNVLCQAQLSTQTKLREAEAKAEMLVAQIRATKEYYLPYSPAFRQLIVNRTEEEQRNLLVYQHTEEKTKLEM